MRMFCLMSVCAAFLAVGTGVADDVVPPRISAEPAARTQPLPVPDQLIRPSRAVAPGIEKNVSAKAVASQETPEVLLGRKEAELECLLQEVERLRAASGQTSTVMVRVTVVEVNRRRLGLKAAEFDKLTTNAQAVSGSASQSHEAAGSEAKTRNDVVEADPTRLPLFRELLERGAVSVLAAPTLTTTSGRLAKYFDGGLLPLKVKTSGGEITTVHGWVGTKLEILPVVFPDHRVRIRTTIELAHKRVRDSQDETRANEFSTVTRGWNTAVEMQLGQTFVIGSARTVRSTANDEAKNAEVTGRSDGNGEEAGDWTAFVFLTPEIVGGPSPSPKNAAGVARDDVSKEEISPAYLDPIDLDDFGPPIPILKRRTLRD